jgi:hypothetical protein
MFRKFVPGGEDLVDQLIADRRQEAQLEEDGPVSEPLRRSTKP